MVLAVAALAETRVLSGAASASARALGDRSGLAALASPTDATTNPKTARLDRAIKIPFEFVEGLMVCDTPTDRGDLRLVFDTGANATALLGKHKPIEIRIGPKSFHLVPAPLRTSALDQVNKMLPPGKRVDGILGEDVLVQFQRVTVDYKHLEIDFDP